MPFVFIIWIAIVIWFVLVSSIIRTIKLFSVIVRLGDRLLPKPYELIRGPTLPAAPIDLCIVFQCKLNKSCIVSSGKILVNLLSHKCYQYICIFVYA